MQYECGARGRRTLCYSFPARHRLTLLSSPGAGAPRAAVQTAVCCRAQPWSRLRGSRSAGVGCRGAWGRRRGEGGQAPGEESRRRRRRRGGSTRVHTRTSACVSQGKEAAAAALAEQRDGRRAAVPLTGDRSPGERGEAGAGDQQEEGSVVQVCSGEARGCTRIGLKMAAIGFRDANPLPQSRLADASSLPGCKRGLSATPLPFPHPVPHSQNTAR